MTVKDGSDRGGRDVIAMSNRSEGFVVVLQIVQDNADGTNGNLHGFEDKGIVFIVCLFTYRTDVPSGVIMKSTGSVRKRRVDNLLQDIVFNLGRIKAAFRTRLGIGIESDVDNGVIASTNVFYRFHIGFFEVEKLQNE